MVATNNLTQEQEQDQREDEYPDAYCYMCTARIEYCRCPPGEGANRLGALESEDDSDFYQEMMDLDAIRRGEADA